MAESSAAERLLTWAGEPPPHPLVDPLDRPVIVEDRECLKRLQHLLARPDRNRRALRRPLAVPPSLLPPA